MNETAIVPVSHGEIVDVENNAAMLAALVNPSTDVVSSLNADSAIDVFDAISNAERLSDHIGVEIKLRDYVAHAIELKDEEGNLVKTIRVVLIADDGAAYAAVSSGVVSALQMLQGLLGPIATWAEPVSVMAVEQRTRTGFRVLTLNRFKPKGK